MSEVDARAAYEAEAIPGPGRPVFEVASGNFNPWAVNRLNYQNPRRAPLLLIGGAEDHLAPAALNLTNCKLYRQAPAATDYHAFPRRSHLIIAQEGWQEVADYALTWTDAAVADDTALAPVSVD